jgi:hypothetical protein
VPELQEAAPMEQRRRVKRRKRKGDPILAYVQILEEGLERLREEVSRARG